MQFVATGPEAEHVAPALDALAPVFEDFYDAEFVPLRRLAYVLTGSAVVAEDLVQETMLRVYSHWSRVATYDKPGAWARRVLCNLATSRGRRLRAEARALVRLRGGRAHGAAPRPESAELWGALRALPPRQAQAMALYYVDDLPVGEIAALLECPAGTVKALLHRGRAALAAQLGEQATEEHP
jgi:RNA polymerase sigma-70 factor (ECF subfamily)